jgi:hypothetical protein
MNRVFLVMPAIIFILLQLNGQTPDAKIEREVIESRAAIRHALKARVRASLERFFY